MKLFWKLYFKLKFKDQYRNRIDNAVRMGWIVDDSTKGNLSHFYDSQGNQIRGWYKPIANRRQHPLIEYYNKN